MSTKSQCSGCGLFVSRDGICRRCDAAPTGTPAMDKNGGTLQNTPADAPISGDTNMDTGTVIVRRDPPPDFRVTRFIDVTLRTWPARMPLTFGVLSGLGVTGAASAGLGLLFGIAGGYGAHLISRRDPAYLDRRDELAMWGKKGWTKIAGALYENPLERLEQEDVPPPMLHDFRSRKRTGGIEQFWIQSRPDRREPANDVPHYSWKLARFRGAVAPELGDVEYAEGGPIVRVDVAFESNGDLPKLREPIDAPFNVFRVGRLLSGGDIDIAPFECINPLLMVTGESGSGKSSLAVQIASKAILQGGTKVLALDGGSGGDFEWLKGPRWKHASEVVQGGPACKERLLDLREELIERNRLMAEHKIERERDDGAWIKTNIVKLADAPQSVIDHLIAEQKWGWLVVLIDEAHRVVGSETSEKDIKSQRAFQGVATDSRKGGVTSALFIHRGDAAHVGGYTRDQFATRINLGKPRRTGARMTHEDEGMHAAAFNLEPSYPPGVGSFEGVGIPPVRRLRHGRLHELDRDWLAEVIREAPRSQQANPPVGGEPRLLGSGDAEVPARGGEERNKPGRAWWRRLFPVDLWWEQGKATLPMCWGTVVHVGKRDPSVQAAFRDAVLAANHGRVRCAMCHESGYVEADHVQPLWAGGANVTYNGQLLCLRCHRRKSGMERWARGVARRKWVIMVSAGVVLLAAARIGGAW